MTRANAQPAGKKIERSSCHLRWVPIARMRVAPGVHQRMKLNRAWVKEIAADFNPDKLNTPTVNLRESWFYIIDGWHRTEACKEAGWGDQQLQCWTYEDLTDSECAELFLDLNHNLTMDAFSKYRSGIAAGRLVECDIDRIVRSQGLVVSREKVPGAVSAVSTLRRVYARGDETLGRTLRIARDAFGDAGYDSHVLDGLGALCQRFNGSLEDAVAVKKLGSVHGGVNGLLNKAEVLRRQTGNSKAQCVAGAAVEIINSGRGGKKLPDWWKS